ncbi:unnamed protein product [Citrullus colocynthis]|uniref:Uncharacterized protein n=1 Tax=Citrullus colocynthis TaxID=252529 RepID=A0ABP0XUM1_9ROSI
MSRSLFKLSHVGLSSTFNCLERIGLTDLGAPKFFHSSQRLYLFLFLFLFFKLFLTILLLHSLKPYFSFLLDAVSPAARSAAVVPALRRNRRRPSLSHSRLSDCDDNPKVLNGCIS